jgi:hypothetical protein
MWKLKKYKFYEIILTKSRQTTNPTYYQWHNLLHQAGVISRLFSCNEHLLVLVIHSYHCLVTVASKTFMSELTENFTELLMNDYNII